MNDNHKHIHDHVKIKQKKTSKFNHVWWIPIIAIFLTGYLVITHYTSKGPLINITFKDANGIAVQKTKIKYKDVDIGEVEKIELSSDNKSVIVSARMSKDITRLLTKGTHFWVVRPRVELTKISGLSTLLSGAYITLDPSSETTEFEGEFIGLDEPPVTSQDKPGLKLTLLASRADVANVGSKIYYKGIAIGTVERKQFSDDYLWVKLDIFIHAPHDKLINSNTVFWSMSGFNVKLGNEGLQVDIDSFEALVAGGITFSTPSSLNHNEPAQNGEEFLLFDNEKESKEQNYGRKLYYVTYFNSSIRGLNVNSPVMIQGISVGKVKDIRLIYDNQQNKALIPVLFEIYENKLGAINTVDVEETIQNLIEKGLRAKLETSNLLSGTKYISLSVASPTTPMNFMPPDQDPITGYTIIPSDPEDISAITNGIAEVLNKINKIPLEDIGRKFSILLDNTNIIAGKGGIQQSVDRLNSLLTSGQLVSAQAKQLLLSLEKNIETLSKSGEVVMTSYSADSPFYYELNKALKQINESLRSIKKVTDMIDRKPNALIFGEDKPHDKK